MREVSFLRHAAFFGPSDAQLPLNIIGVGATGSNIGLIAAKMGYHKFRIWDPDIVENHNLPNQIYDVHHIGQKKVDAFKDVLTRFNPMVEVETFDTYFTSKNKNQLHGPLILTVDTMLSRKNIFDAFNLNYKVKKVFETRFGFDFAELNVLDNMDLFETENWKNGLLNDEDIPEGPCNLRICTTLVHIVAAETVHILCHSLTNDDEILKKHIFHLKPQLKTYHIS